MPLQNITVAVDVVVVAVVVVVVVVVSKTILCYLDFD